jgi:TonB family protein
MRSASFLLLSVALHAAALAYPVSFPDGKRQEIIPVVILASGADGVGSGERREESGDRPPQGPARSPQRRAPAIKNIIDTNRTKSDGQPIQSAEAPADFVENGEVSLLHPSSMSAQTDSFGKVASAGLDGKSPDRVGGNAKGLGSSGSGAGLGNGQGASGNGTALIQPRYSETPKPAYPDSARSEGREGRVLLRVLVDDQGRAKRVEINSSSGSAALDRAATEAIKRWRFIPARYGDKTVESWIRVPIEFSLADSNSR